MRKVFRNIAGFQPSGFAGVFPGPGDPGWYAIAPLVRRLAGDWIALGYLSRLLELICKTLSAGFLDFVSRRVRRGRKGFREWDASKATHYSKLGRAFS